MEADIMVYCLVSAPVEDLLVFLLSDSRHIHYNIVRDCLIFFVLSTTDWSDYQLKYYLRAPAISVDEYQYHLLSETISNLHNSGLLKMLHAETFLENQPQPRRS